MIKLRNHTLRDLGLLAIGTPLTLGIYLAMGWHPARGLGAALIAIGIMWGCARIASGKV